MAATSSMNRNISLNCLALITSFRLVFHTCPYTENKKRFTMKETVIRSDWYTFNIWIIFDPNLKKKGYLTQPAFTCSKLAMETLEQRCEICSKLIIKPPKLRQWRRFGGFIVNFEHISHFCFSVSIVNFEQVNAGWGIKFEFEFKVAVSNIFLLLSTILFSYSN